MLTKRNLLCLFFLFFFCFLFVFVFKANEEKPFVFIWQGSVDFRHPRQRGLSRIGTRLVMSNRQKFGVENEI